MDPLDERNVRVEDDGTVIYRASALGGNCTRALVLSRLGYDERPPPPDMLERYNEGHAHEELVVARMRDEGWTIWDRQLEVVLMVSGRIKVMGHIDGKGTVDPKGGPNLLVEIKSQSKDEWEGFERNGWDHGYFPQYKWQLSVYMHATGLPAVMVRKNRNNGQIKMEWVDEPFYEVKDIRARVLSVEMLAADGIGPDDCSPGRIYPCPFFYMPGHEAGVEKGESKDGKLPVARRVLAGEEAKALDRLAKTYEMARQNESVAKDAKDSARRELEAAGEGASGLDLDTGTRVTFWTQRAGRRGLSKEMEDRLRAAILWYFGVDIDVYRDQAVVNRMKVTLREDDDGQGH